MKRALYCLMLLSLFGCSQKNYGTAGKNNSQNKNEEPIIVNTKANHDVSMYPKAKEGYKRIIIKLEQMQNETNHLVEFYVGKTMSVDCNNHSLVGSFSEEHIQGWGYSFWKFDSDGQVISTMMGCPDETKRELFVQSSAQKTRYNSKLPIVIYIPEEYSVRYHIWSRGEKTYTTE